jgi:hypothetical protein
MIDFSKQLFLVKTNMSLWHELKLSLMQILMDLYFD